MPYSTVTSLQQVTADFMNVNWRNQTIATVTDAGKPAGTEGQAVAVTDKDRLEVYSGSTWWPGPAWSATGRIGCTISRVATQAISTATDTTITFDTETTDLNGFITVPSDTLTVPAPSGLNVSGLYNGTATVIWASAPGANNVARLEIGGVTGDYGSSCGTSTVAYQRHTVSFAAIPLSTTNTIKLRVYQASGGSINVTARLELWRVG